MKNSGYRETGRDEPKSKQVQDFEIKEHCKAILYALDSILDEYLEDIIRIVGFVGDVTGRSWHDKIKV